MVYNLIDNSFRIATGLTLKVLQICWPINIDTLWKNDHNFL